MKLAFTIIQWINILLIVSETSVVFRNMKKRVHYYLFLNCIAMFICSMGSLLMLFVETEGAYFISLMLSWAGRIGVIVSTFFFCIELCESKLPVIITAMESGFAFVSFVVIATTRETGLFYKNYYLEKVGGLTAFQYEEGPWCILWNITIVVVIATCLVMLFKALTTEKNQHKRKQYKIIIFVLFMEIGVGYLTVLPIGRYYDFNQLGFSLCAILILYAIFRNNLMDAESMAKEYIIDELSSGVIAMDTGGSVAYYNKKALQIFPELIRDKRAVISRIECSIQTGEPIFVNDRVYNFEERKLVHKSLAESTLYVLIDSTRHYEHIREMEREKQVADNANKAKTDFLASMSHEIRTPINAVLGMDEMILRESTESNIKEYALDIQAAGRTLLTIINDILDLNKLESGKMEIVPVEYDVSSMIYDLANMLKVKAEDKKLSFNVSVSPDIPARLRGDDVE